MLKPLAPSRAAKGQATANSNSSATCRTRSEELIDFDHESETHFECVQTDPWAVVEARGLHDPTNGQTDMITPCAGKVMDSTSAKADRFAGQAEVEFNHSLNEWGEAPGIYVDEMTIEEAPPPPTALFTPTTLVFPNSNVDFVTDGWDFVSDEEGQILASTTLQELPPSSMAKAKFGPFDLTGLRSPTLRIRGRYRIAKDAVPQIITVE